MGTVGAVDLRVTYTVVWSIQAARARRRLRLLDPDSAALLTAATNALAENPWPPNAAALGGSGWCYLRLGQLRVMYEVRDDQHVVHLDNIGRLPPPRH
jgi:mRNA-degrading endonuclease RelE of RelBE toxin-antitoxin system